MGAFFMGGLSFSFSSAAAICPADHIDEQVTIEHIYDGDSVRLKGGRKLRLIGINTPEIGRNGSADEPYAKQASDALKNILSKPGTLGLRYGAEKKDRYKRVLAHLFLANGDSVAAKLVQQGLAAVIVVPPNTWNLDCYARQEKKAAASHTGIWSPANNIIIKAEEINQNQKGFRIVEGHINKVSHSKKSIWLNLRGGVGIRIARTDLPNFPGADFDALNNHNIIARGWLYYYKNQPVIRIRHPLALKRL